MLIAPLPDGGLVKAQSVWHRTCMASSQKHHLLPCTAWRAWLEDIAELVTIYHLTTRLNQPFYVMVTKGHIEVARFKPMKYSLVKPRLNQLAAFYAS